MDININDKEEVTTLSKMDINVLNTLKSKAKDNKITRNDIVSLEDDFLNRYFKDLHVNRLTVMPCRQNSILISDIVDKHLLDSKINPYQYLSMLDKLISNLNRYKLLYKREDFINIKALLNFYDLHNVDDNMTYKDFIYSKQDIFIISGLENHLKSVINDLNNGERHIALQYIKHKVYPITISDTDIDIFKVNNELEYEDIYFKSLYKIVNNNLVEKMAYFERYIDMLIKHKDSIEKGFNSDYGYVTDLIKDNSDKLNTLLNIYNENTLKLLTLIVNQLKNIDIV